MHFTIKFLGALDGTPTQWHECSFTFLGKVTQGLISMVVFPAKDFNVLTVQVKTVQYMLHYQAELTDLLMVPLVFNDDEVSELITTRNFMSLPAVHMQLLLYSRSYRITQVWEMLYLVIAQ
jgi:hypothetical protein